MPTTNTNPLTCDDTGEIDGKNPADSFVNDHHFFNHSQPAAAFVEQGRFHVPTTIPILTIYDLIQTKLELSQEDKTFEVAEGLTFEEWKKSLRPKSDGGLFTPSYSAARRKAELLLKEDNTIDIIHKARMHIHIARSLLEAGGLQSVIKHLDMAYKLTNGRSEKEAITLADFARAHWLELSPKKPSDSGCCTAGTIDGFSSGSIGYCLARNLDPRLVIMKLQSNPILNPLQPCELKHAHSLIFDEISSVDDYLTKMRLLPTNLHDALYINLIYVSLDKMNLWTTCDKALLKRIPIQYSKAVFERMMDYYSSEGKLREVLNTVSDFGHKQISTVYVKMLMEFNLDGGNQDTFELVLKGVNLIDGLSERDTKYRQTIQSRVIKAAISADMTLYLYEQKTLAFDRFTHEDKIIILENLLGRPSKKPGDRLESLKFREYAKELMRLSPPHKEYCSERLKSHLKAYSDSTILWLQDLQKRGAPFWTEDQMDILAAEIGSLAAGDIQCDEIASLQRNYLIHLESRFTCYASSQGYFNLNNLCAVSLQLNKLHAFTNEHRNAFETPLTGYVNSKLEELEQSLQGLMHYKSFAFLAGYTYGETNSLILKLRQLRVNYDELVKFKDHFSEAIEPKLMAENRDRWYGSSSSSGNASSSCNDSKKEIVGMYSGYTSGQM